MPSFVIVEGNAEFATALRSIIAEIEDSELLGIFDTAEKAAAAIPGFGKSIVITDIISKGNMTGIDLIRKFKPSRPELEFLVCTSYHDKDSIFDALSSGASGYILKDSSVTEIKKSLLDIIGGGVAISPAIARKVVAIFEADTNQKSLKNFNLTQIETEVLDLLAKGLPYKEIADRLDIDATDVRAHIRDIYRKLGRR